MTKDVPLRNLFDTMRIYLGSLYVNDFNRFGRTWQVIVQAEPRFRNQVEDVKRLKVRNAQGMMVPVGTLADIREQNGPLVLMRYNTKPAAPINGKAAPGRELGTRRSRSWRSSPATTCRRRCPPNGPSWPFSSSRPGTRP